MLRFRKDSFSRVLPQRSARTRPATISPSRSTTSSHSFLSGLLLLRLLEHLLHDLLLLDQERAHDAVPHAVAASRSAIGTLDGLLGFGGRGVFSGSEGWDLFSSKAKLLDSLRSHFGFLANVLSLRGHFFRFRCFGFCPTTGM